MRLFGSAALALAAAIAVAGCGSQAATPLVSRPGAPLTTWQSHCPSGMACTAGEAYLEGHARSRGECLWLEDLTGRRLGISWPPGFTASFEPLLIYDPAGHLVVHQDDHVVTGGSIPGPFVVPESCGLQDAVAISEISKVNP
jgi:hypothetical protein